MIFHFITPMQSFYNHMYVSCWIRKNIRLVVIFQSFDVHIHSYMKAININSKWFTKWIKKIEYFSLYGTDITSDLHRFIKTFANAPQILKIKTNNFIMKKLIVLQRRKEKLNIFWLKNVKFGRYLCVWWINVLINSLKYLLQKLLYN